MKIEHLDIGSAYEMVSALMSHPEANKIVIYAVKAYAHKRPETAVNDLLRLIPEIARIAYEREREGRWEAQSAVADALMLTAVREEGRKSRAKDKSHIGTTELVCLIRVVRAVLPDGKGLGTNHCGYVNSEAANLLRELAKPEVRAKYGPGGTDWKWCVQQGHAKFLEAVYRELDQPIDQEQPK